MTPEEIALAEAPPWWLAFLSRREERRRYLAEAAFAWERRERGAEAA